MLQPHKWAWFQLLHGQLWNQPSATGIDCSLVRSCFLAFAAAQRHIGHSSHTVSMCSPLEGKLWEAARVVEVVWVEAILLNRWRTRDWVACYQSSCNGNININNYHIRLQMSQLLFKNLGKCSFKRQAKGILLLHNTFFTFKGFSIKLAGRIFKRKERTILR